MSHKSVWAKIDLNIILSSFKPTNLVCTSNTLSLSYSEGVRHLEKEYNAFWLLNEIDGIAKRYNSTTFLIILERLHMGKDRFVLIAEDGKDNIFHIRNIYNPDTYFDMAKLFIENGRILLPSEK